MSRLSFNQHALPAALCCSRRLKPVFFLFIFLLLVPLEAPAQDADSERRWALDGALGPVKLTNLHTMGQSINSSLPSVKTGLMTSLHAEYFILASHFSLTAGYEKEELNYQGQDLSANLQQAMLGGRWYPAPKEWMVQPYIGLDAFCNLGSTRQTITMNSSATPVSKAYERTGIIRLPRFSMAPVVGVDLYILSSVALQVTYSYRMGINSHADIRSRYTDSSATSLSHGSIHRHALAFGLKFTFPFSFTIKDADNLLNLLMGDDDDY